MPAKTIKPATKPAKATKAAKDAKAKTTKTATTSAKATGAKPAAKTGRAAAAPKSANTGAQAVKDARESNRLRQERFLEKHREEINEKRRERYADRKDGGKCPRCGAKLLKSSKNTLCNDCLEKARDYNQR